MKISIANAQCGCHLIISVNHRDGWNTPPNGVEHVAYKTQYITHPNLSSNDPINTWHLLLIFNWSSNM